MSSHHIVRDEQEPALYIHGADNFLLESIGDLLEWSPTVIVNSSTLRKVVDFGMKVDAITSVPDNSNRDLLEEQRPIRLLDIEAEDVCLLLEAYDREGYTGINIATHEEAVQTIRGNLQEYDGRMHCSLHTSRERWTRVSKPFFEKWVPSGDYGILPDPGVSITTTGFVNDFMDHSVEDQFTVASPGMIQISCNRPAFWFIEYLT